MNGTFPLSVTVCGKGTTIACDGQQVNFNNITIEGVNFKPTTGTVVFIPPAGFEPLDSSAKGSASIHTTGSTGSMYFAWNGTAFAITSANQLSGNITRVSKFTLKYAINPVTTSMTGDEVVTYKMLKQLI